MFIQLFRTNSRETRWSQDHGLPELKVPEIHGFCVAGEKPEFPQIRKPTGTYNCIPLKVKVFVSPFGRGLYHVSNRCIQNMHVVEKQYNSWRLATARRFSRNPLRGWAVMVKKLCPRKLNPFISVWLAETQVKTMEVKFNWITDLTWYSPGMRQFNQNLLEKWFQVPQRLARLYWTRAPS